MPTLRIGLDVRYASDHFPGIGRYTLGLARGLAELESGHTLLLIVDPRADMQRYDLAALTQLPNVELVPLAAGPFSLRQQLLMPALVRRMRLDLLHSPYYVKPYLPLGCPSVVTIYDLFGWRFPRELSRRGRLFYRLTMGLAVRTAAALLTPSESARADLLHVYRLDPGRVTVTLAAAERRFCPQPPDMVAALRQRYTLPERYVLYLGAQKPHKNLERLLRAWRRLGEADAASGSVLVIAGHATAHGQQLRLLVETLGLSTTVRFIPNVADADLPALYSGAELFVFPSYYEGFGLPPLEAMACGTPVLCAYATSLPEVVGNAAMTFDPYNVIELAESLARLLNNPSLRRDLSTRGRRRARDFSWRRTAMVTLPIYERLAGSG
jgi:glycosyltransferase involved in cell wall biosynthesis